MRLTKKFKETMRKDLLVCELALILQVSSYTIRRWVFKDDKYDNLTHPKHLNDLIFVTGLKADEIIQKS
jgi:hypothetical protein